MRNRISLTTLNSKLNGEWGKHVKKWQKRITSHRRRQRNKKFIKQELDNL